jgi:hypothetical protein
LSAVSLIAEPIFSLNQYVQNVHVIQGILEKALLIIILIYLYTIFDMFHNLLKLFKVFIFILYLNYAIFYTVFKLNLYVYLLIIFKALR